MGINTSDLPILMALMPENEKNTNVISNLQTSQLIKFSSSHMVLKLEKLNPIINPKSHFLKMALCTIQLVKTLRKLLMMIKKMYLLNFTLLGALIVKLQLQFGIDLQKNFLIIPILCSLRLMVLKMILKICNQKISLL